MQYNIKQYNAKMYNLKPKEVRKHTRNKHITEQDRDGIATQNHNLDAHGSSLGKKSTLDLDAMLEPL